MRALTLTAPWSGIVADSIKLVENRPQKAPKSLIGQRFAIHASRELDRRVFERIAELAPEIKPSPLWRVTSAIIAVATLVADVAVEDRDIYIEPAQRRWAFGDRCYLLADVVRLPRTVACKGMLGFWSIPADTQRLVDAEIAAAAGMVAG